MTHRSTIPAEIRRQILIECGHRCAVCGTPCPLERAHIVPWSKTADHSLTNIICLCANCHERADQEHWGVKILHQYKKQPWVNRQFLILKTSTNDTLERSMDRTLSSPSIAKSNVASTHAHRARNQRLTLGTFLQTIDRAGLKTHVANFGSDAWLLHAFLFAYRQFPLLLQIRDGNPDNSNYMGCAVERITMGSSKTGMSPAFNVATEISGNKSAFVKSLILSRKKAEDHPIIYHHNNFWRVITRAKGEKGALVGIISVGVAVVPPSMQLHVIDILNWVKRVTMALEFLFQFKRTSCEIELIIKKSPREYSEWSASLKISDRNLLRLFARTDQVPTSPQTQIRVEWHDNIIASALRRLAATKSMSSVLNKFLTPLLFNALIHK